MALVLKDRVLETASTTGTGTFTLNGAVTDFQNFTTAIGLGNTTYYTITHDTTGEWEVGIGTVGTNTLTRDTVLASSTGSKIDFTPGGKNVFCDYPASKSVYQDSNGLVTVPNLATNSASSLTPVLTYNASNSAQTNGATVAGSYLQNVMQNKSGTAGASTNFAVSNDLGTDSTYYGEFGMNSSIFSSGTPSDYFSLNNGIYFSGHDGDITYGSGNGYKTFLAWGTTGDKAHVINASGAIGLNTNITGTTNFGTAGQVLTSQGSAATPTWTTNGAGDVVGPASATDNAVSRFDLTTGKLIQNSLVTISDTGAISAPVDASISGLTVGLGAGAVATNTVIGAGSLASNATGAYLTALGYQSLNKNTASYSTAIGYSALYGNTTGSNTAVGSVTLYVNTTGTNNVAVGGTDGTVNPALRFNTTGSFNTAIGVGSLALNTTASNNTAVGYQAGYSNTTGTTIDAFGHQALYSNTTGNANVAMGKSSLYSNTTGGSNTAIGYVALGNNSTGSYNTALGQDSLRLNTTASGNTAVGYQAAYSNTFGANLTALGYQAGFSNTVGEITAIGYLSLNANTTGTNNTSVGVVSLLTNTTGQDNSALGRSSLRLNSTGSYNTALGSSALYSNTTASNNTAVGYQAGYTQSGASTGNSYYGYQSGYGVTTGTYNVILGSYQGSAAPISATGSNFVVLSDGQGNIVASTKNGQTFALQGATLSAGTGITFPATQSASSNANTLDDYEEGTWTPAILLGVGSVTYTTQTGTYTKIGRLVTVQLNIVVNVATTPSGTFEITGLPFTVSATEKGSTSASFLNAWSATLTGTLVGSATPSTTKIRMYELSAGSLTNPGAKVASGCGIQLTVLYEV